jgi:hypothetical protein
MVDITDAQIDAALERGKIALETEPRAATARYDRQLDRVIVDLTNGCTFAFLLGLPRAWKRPLPISSPRSKSLAWDMGCTGKVWMLTCPFPA